MLRASSRAGLQRSDDQTTSIFLHSRAGRILKFLAWRVSFETNYSNYHQPIERKPMRQRAKLWLMDALPVQERIKALGSGWVRAGFDWAANTKLGNWTRDKRDFYRAFRANPKGVGAVAPSSAALARAITKHIHPSTGCVIELGAGTGVFTRALIAKGVEPCDLALVEMDPSFSQMLRREFPEAEHYPIDAATLHRHALFGGERAGAAVCGLPLLNMPIKQQVGILRALFAQLDAGGACYLFTYGVRCPVNPRVLERMGLRARKIDVVLGNIPPAHVWKLNRRGWRVRT